jgi:putative methionine-R-sulfoxide reductase with GAF domain
MSIVVLVFKDGKLESVVDSDHYNLTDDFRRTLEQMVEQLTKE